MNSFVSGWDWSQFLYEWDKDSQELLKQVGLVRIPLQVGEIITGTG